MGAIGHALSGYTPLDLLLVLIAVVAMPVFSAIAGRALAPMFSRKARGG